MCSCKGTSYHRLFTIFCVIFLKKFWPFTIFFCTATYIKGQLNTADNAHHTPSTKQSPVFWQPPALT